MKRKVIQDFLNLPGIAGVALMDGRSRPYFCGVDETLNFQQKEALAQGLLQVVETMPDGFNVFEFQFTKHQAHLYKLDRGMVLLVLTSQGLVYADYLGIINQLKALLQEDMPNAIATFRLMAGNITLSGLHYRRQSADSAAIAGTTTTSAQDLPPALDDPSQPLEALSDRPTVTPQPESATLNDAIVTLNHFSQFTTQYLGTHVIANYWKATRPQSECLANLQIDRTAQFSLIGSPSQGTDRPLTLEEQAWLKGWVAAFIKRSAQVIRDFPAIVEQKALNDLQKALLLG